MARARDARPERVPGRVPAAEYLRTLQSSLEEATSSESEEIQEAMQVGLSMLVEDGD